MLDSPATTVRRVGVIGAGTMGTGIALTYALSGRDVTIYTRRPDRATAALADVRRLGEQLVTADHCTADQLAAAIGRIGSTTDLSAAAATDHLVEAVAEELPVKQQVLADVDELAPAEVLIASTTTALPVTALAQRCRHPERVLATHFYLPAPLMPLVEVVPGERTGAGAVAAACALLTGIGKEPVVLRDVPGTVGPRLLTALVGEAFRIVADGVADPPTVDRVLSRGIGRRFPVTGIFDRMDLAGLDTVAAVLRSRGAPVPAPLAELVEAGQLGTKSGRGFYDWSGDRAGAVERELVRHLAATAAPGPPAAGPEVLFDESILAPFLAAAGTEYEQSTPQAPPGCFAVLSGRVEADHYRVERLDFGRNVRATDSTATDVFDTVVVPCFGPAYANQRRGFWCDAKDLLRISRSVEADGRELLGSIHLHPDWHRIGPPAERGLPISDRPTPMDRFLLRQTGWPVNLICYLEHRHGRRYRSLAGWAPDGTELAVRLG